MDLLYVRLDIRRLGKRYTVLVSSNKYQWNAVYESHILEQAQRIMQAYINEGLEPIE